MCERKKNYSMASDENENDDDDDGDDEDVGYNDIVSTFFKLVNGGSNFRFCMNPIMKRCYLSSTLIGIN